MEIALSGIASDRELGEVARDLEPLHPKNNTFLGELLLELAADAIEESGASRAAPLDMERVRERLLPEDRAHTRAQHHEAEFALRAGAMVRAGVDPALLDEVAWWREDDLWFWCLEALVVYVRAASERTGQPIVQICQQIADHHDVRITSPA